MGPSLAVRIPGVVSVAALGLVLLAGCGDAEPEAAADPTAAQSTPASENSDVAEVTSDLPECSSLWVAGEDLPRNYRGCNEAGADVRADKHKCSYGASIVTYDGRFYAVTGRVINEVSDLATDKFYRRALDACQA